MEKIEEKVKLRPLQKEGKSKLYKSKDGIILHTGSFIDAETKEPIFASRKRFDWVECIEIDTHEIDGLHLAQCDIKDGKLVKDVDWSKTVMPANKIIVKHEKRMQAEIDSELEKESPDTGKVLKLMREQKRVRDMRFNKDFRKNPPKEVYEIALKNLEVNTANGGTDKPKIKKALKDKLSEYK